MQTAVTDDTTDREAVGVVAFAYEMGVLKRLRRAGWWRVGVRDPESVAEHSLRVAQLAALIASEEGGDPAPGRISRHVARLAGDADRRYPG
jgi:putative hydrolase of HD superfamily